MLITRIYYAIVKYVLGILTFFHPDIIHFIYCTMFHKWILYIIHIYISITEDIFLDQPKPHSLCEFAMLIFPIVLIVKYFFLLNVTPFILKYRNYRK